MIGLSKGASFFARGHLCDSQDWVAEPTNFQTSPEAGEEKRLPKPSMQTFHWMARTKLA